MDDQDPLLFAGEGFSDPDEIARADDVSGNPYLRGRVMEEGYYPGAKRKKNGKR